MSRIRVVLFPGHKGPGTGAVSDGYDEWETNADLANVIGAHLVATGRYHAPQATGGGSSHITSRVQCALGFNPDLALSIHLNANEGTPGTGTEAWFHTPDPGEPEPTHSGKLATYLSGYVAAALELRDRGPKRYIPPTPEERRLGTRRTISLLEKLHGVCPVALLEVCFINNPADRAALYGEAFGHERVAGAVGHALDDWVAQWRSSP